MVQIENSNCRSLQAWNWMEIPAKIGLEELFMICSDFLIVMNKLEKFQYAGVSGLRNFMCLSGTLSRNLCPLSKFYVPSLWIISIFISHECLLLASKMTFGKKWDKLIWNLNNSKSLQDISMKSTPFSLIFKELSNDTKYIVVWPTKRWLFDTKLCVLRAQLMKNMRHALIICSNDA